MKVELNNITIGVSPITGEVYLGILDKKGDKWKYKKDITARFISCIIEKFNINNEENIYNITSRNTGTVYKFSIKENPKKDNKEK